MSTHSQLDIKNIEASFNGFFRIETVTLRHKLFNGGWSSEMQREIFRRGDAVGVLLYDPKLDCIGLVEQFRIGAAMADHATSENPWLREIVAGMVPKSETPRAVAVRETLEEAGIEIQVDQLMPIFDYWVSPGGMDERFYLYCACVDLSEAGGIFGLDYEHEDIRFFTLDYEATINGLNVGEFDNSATIICLQWLQLNRQKLKGE